MQDKEVERDMYEWENRKYANKKNSNMEELQSKRGTK